MESGFKKEQVRFLIRSICDEDVLLMRKECSAFASDNVDIAEFLLRRMEVQVPLGAVAVHMQHSVCSRLPVTSCQ